MDAHYECRHLLVMVDRMAREGRSQREIEAAVRSGTAEFRQASNRRLLRRARPAVRRTLRALVLHN